MSRSCGSNELGFEIQGDGSLNIYICEHSILKPDRSSVELPDSSLRLTIGVVHMHMLMLML